MSRLTIAVNKRSSQQWIGEIYCLVLLLLPITIIQATSIYTTTTPAQIWYKYTSFYFSALLIPAIIWAIAVRRRSYAIPFDIVIVGIVIKDFLMITFSKNAFYVEYNFSFNLVLISAWSIVCIIFRFVNNDNTESVESFFDNYFLLAVLSQFLRLILRMSTDGRYGAIGLSVGGTGYFAGLYLIYCLYYRGFTSRVRNIIIIAFVSLILSGQRSNMLFFLIFCIPYIFQKFSERRVSKGEKSKIVLLWCLAGIGVLLISLIIFLNELGVEIEGFRFITRTIEAIDLFANGSISSEMSVEGRMLSLNAGFDILKNNPLGLTNNFYELQYRMLQHAYPTFPHNTTLCCYLLWSPFITLLCLLYVAKLLIEARRMRLGLMWPVLYIFLYNIITGSVFLDYPYLAINLIFISLLKCKINQTLSQRQQEDELEE